MFEPPDMDIDHELWMGAENRRQRVGSSPGSHHFKSYRSSTTIINGANPPVVREKSKTEMRLPGQVIEKQEFEYDSRTGLERLQLSRNIGSRGRQIIKEKQGSGPPVTSDCLIGLSPDEAAHFDEEWSRASKAAGQFNHMLLPVGSSSPDRRIVSGANNRNFKTADNSAMTSRRTTPMQLENSQSYRSRAETPMQLENSQSYRRRAETLPSNHEGENTRRRAETQPKQPLRSTLSSREILDKIHGRQATSTTKQLSGQPSAFRPPSSRNS